MTNLFLSVDKLKATIAILNYENKQVLNQLLNADEDNIFPLQKAYKTIGLIINKLEQMKEDDVAGYETEIKEGV